MKSLFKRNVIIGKTLIHGDRYLYIVIAAEWIRRCGMLYPQSKHCSLCFNHLFKFQA